jgi:uncharacterized membrane protein (DUF441 family)
MIRLKGVWGPIYILAVAVLFSSATGSTYAFLLPAFFAGYKAGWILVMGVLVAALLGGYIGYRNADGDSLPAKIGVSIAYGAVEVVLVTFLSLLIILNTRGG